MIDPFLHKVAGYVLGYRQFLLSLVLKLHFYFFIIQHLSGGGKRSRCGLIPTFCGDLTVHNLKTKLLKYGTKPWKSGRHLEKLKLMLTKVWTMWIIPTWAVLWVLTSVQTCWHTGTVLLLERKVVILFLSILTYQPAYGYLFSRHHPSHLLGKHRW